MNFTFKNIPNVATSIKNRRDSTCTSAVLIIGIATRDNSASYGWIVGFLSPLRVDISLRWLSSLAWRHYPRGLRALLVPEGYASLQMNMQYKLLIFGHDGVGEGAVEGFFGVGELGKVGGDDVYVPADGGACLGG